MVVTINRLSDKNTQRRAVFIAGDRRPGNCINT